MASWLCPALVLMWSPGSVFGAKSFGASLKGVRVHYGVERSVFTRNCTKAEAPCTMHHWWSGGTFPGYARSRVRYYVDGDSVPVNIPLGPGHGMGFRTDDTGPWSAGTLFGRSGVGLHAGGNDAGSGFFNTHQVPFSSSINITVDLYGPQGQPQYFWLIVRGRTNAVLRLPGLGAPLPPTARLRSYEATATALQPYAPLPVLNSTASGGCVVMTTLAVQAPKNAFAFLEGMFRAVSPGEPVWELASGTEDYFLGTFYFDKGQYFLPLAGVTSFCPQPSDGAPRIPSVGCVPAADHSISFSAYRVHAGVEPLLFEQGLAVTWRNGEPGHGHGVEAVNATTFALVYEW